LKGPVMAGSIQTGWCAHQPVYCSVIAFDPKAEEYRAKKSEWAAAYYDRKLAEQGRTRQPRKPPMTAEEKKERAKARARARFLAMTPEERAEMYARNNARRKAARDAETPEQRKARNAHAYALEKARHECKG